jgi:hypothetical protein
MPSLVPLTLRQSNDETVHVTIVPDDPSESLVPVTLLMFYLKDDVCTSDIATSTLKLTSANPAQINITTHTATQIICDVYIPASSLATPYPRVWRIDAYIGTSHRTAVYGPVALIDL